MATQTLRLWLAGKTWRLHSTSTESRSPFSPEHTFCNFLPPLQIQTDAQHRYTCTTVLKISLLELSPHPKAYRGVKIQCHAFLPSASKAREWPVSRAGCLPCGENHR
jgi:hypothetical protein